MRLTKRLEALEVAVIKASPPEPVDIVRVIIAPDRSINGAYRRVRGELVSVSDSELSEFRGQDEGR